MRACKEYLKLTNTKIRTIKSSCPLKVNTLIRIEKILPKNFCPLLLYSLYPYYLTLSNGGWFRWVKEGGEVILHCPNPEGIVLGVKKKKNGIIARMTKNKGQCPEKYKIGNKFEISENLIKFCPQALYLIIPHLTRKGSFLISCSCSAGEASFELSNQD